MKKIILADFREGVLKISHGKKHYQVKIFCFFSYQLFWINLGVIVLIGLIVVLIFPGGPFILKLMPNNPSPTSFGITISPITGIFEIILFKVLAGIMYLLN